MEEREFQLYYQQEDFHWWFVNRYKIIESILRQILIAPEKGYTLLDIGCGTGGLLNKISDFNGVAAYGLDSSITGLKFCRKRGLEHIFQAQAMTLPLKDASVDIAICCEVLDHATVNPQAALREMYRVCKKDSWLIISDVALEFLKSEHDKVYHTQHRFSREEMVDMITQEKFKISKISYYNFLLFPIVASIRIWRRFFKSKDVMHSDLKQPNRIINNFLVGFLGIERWLLKNYNLPWGSSLFCLARKE